MTSHIYSIAGLAVSVPAPVVGFDSFASEAEVDLATSFDSSWNDPERTHLDIQDHNGQLCFVGEDEIVRGQLSVDGREARLASGPTLPYLVRSAWHYAYVLQGGLVVHAAGVVDRRGRGWLIPGPSGAGKSTFASRFDVSSVLSDEIIAVCEGQMHATPFRTGGCRQVSLHGLLFLEQGDSFEWRPCLSSEALMRLVPEAPWATAAPSWGRHLLDGLAELSEQIPARVLTFSLNDDVPRRLEEMPDASE